MHQNDNETARVVNLAGFVSLCFTLPCDLDEFTPVVRLFIARWSRSLFSSYRNFEQGYRQSSERLPSTIYIFGSSLRNDYRRMRFRGVEARGATPAKSAQLRGNFEKQPSVGARTDCLTLRLSPIASSASRQRVRVSCKTSQLSLLFRIIFNNVIFFFIIIILTDTTFHVISFFFRKDSTNKRISIKTGNLQEFIVS